MTVNRTKTMPIAVIGMGCRFPGDASSPDKLWEVCAAARNTWSEWPKNRMNESAFYHPRVENIGTVDSQSGGHFLNEDVSLCDTSFFNFTADVARGMDPQVRMLLETVYEGFENAGLSLEDVSGTSTSVFAGAMFQDYKDMLVQDTENLPRYFLTGTGPGLLSNGVSHFYNLLGPSVTVDTACSTSMTALHLACQSLRTGDSEMAVVGGSNLMLFPATSVGLSTLGLTGAAGKSYSFDSRAQGYGRGEGVGCVILKPLDAALRDGDPIRAVIRETAMNQDGRTPTLTSPSQEAQESIIRTCYKKAGLDPLDTTYVECHGTGTIAGDTIETSAIGATFGKGRSPDEPLLVGSIKANFGHTESTSGVAAIIKVVLMLEKGYISPQALFSTPNPKIDFTRLNIKVPTELMPWPENKLRRISISNFGAGGTNTHAIIEHASYHIPTENSMGSVLPNGIGENHNQGVLLFTVSAKEESSARAATQQLKNYLDAADPSGRFQDLAYTLNQRRSPFPWRVAIAAQSLSELRDALADPVLRPTQAPLQKVPRLGFVFTGQGAQWHAMGRELITAYPLFRQTLEDADVRLKLLGASWSVFDELRKDESTSQLNKPFLSFPVTVILQLALVQLLKSWGIIPKAVTGHSSGEISAAYAAGILTFNDAIAIAYLRGQLTSSFVESGRLEGGMVALGVGKEEAAQYLQEVKSGMAVIACVNSPQSVTISGDATALKEIEAIASSKGAFYRRLKVPAAYHSSHMEVLAPDYSAQLSTQMSQDRPAEDRVIFSSPVTGSIIEDDGIVRNPTHWVQNMVGCVQFEDSLKAMITGGGSAGSKDTINIVDAIVEIGPHAALRGAINQTLAHSSRKKMKISVDNCLKRGEDAIRTMKELVGRLYCQGYPIDFKAVNFPKFDGQLQVLTDLPHYQWHYSAGHWAGPARATEMMQRPHARHDLLGVRVEGLNPDQQIWKNTIRISDLPWLQDHLLQSEVLYPGAGWAAMVAEAMRQIVPSASEPIIGYMVSEVELYNALVVPKADQGVEVQLVIKDETSQILEHQRKKEFSFFSRGKNGTWAGHCKGKASIASSQPVFTGSMPDPSKVKPVDMTHFYENITQFGPTFGRSFQNLITLNRGTVATATVTLPDTLSMMSTQYQSDYWVHPTTLDACFQVAWATVPENTIAQLGLCLPKFTKRLFLGSTAHLAPGAILDVVATLNEVDHQGFEVSVWAFEAADVEKKLILHTDGLRIQSLSRGQVFDEVNNSIVLKTEWQPDLSLLSQQDLESAISIPDATTEERHVSDTQRDLRRATINAIHDALVQIPPQQPLEGHYLKLVSWMRAQDEALYVHNAIEDEKEKKGLYDRVTQASTEGRLVGLALANFLSIINGEADSRKVLYQDGALNSLDTSASMLSKVKRYASLYAHKYPRARILEIGAGSGTGSTTVLEGLSQNDPNLLRAVTYHYTDPSPESFVAAQDTFEKFSSQMQYSVLDIEQTPAEQGFDEHAYDLLVAYNSLHDTSNIRKSLQNSRKLLKPGGKILIVEPTTTQLEQQFVLGLLPSWWSFEDEEHKTFPLLDSESWTSILAEAGFGKLDVMVHDSDRPRETTYSLMVATADGEMADNAASYPKETCLVHLERPHVENKKWVNELGQSLHTLTGTTVSIGVGTSSLQGKTCVMLVESEFLASLNSEEFGVLKRIALEAENVMWVSQGATCESTSPEASMHIGFLRTLRMEEEGKKYISLDLDAKEDYWQPANIQAICDVFCQSLDSARHDSRDYEFSRQSGLILTPRYIGNAPLNEEFESLQGHHLSQRKGFSFSDPYTRLEVRVPGLLDSLVFRQYDEAAGLPPWTEDMVEIKPHAFGLNFRDVLVAMGEMQEKWMGFECAGYISRVGSNVPRDLQVGTRVCSMQAGHWSNKVRSKWTSVVPIPDDMTFETAASIPVCFVTAYHAFVNLAQLESDETVLIHTGAGGVGQAAITIAQHIGAEIYTTVGSEEKRKFLTQTYGIPDDHIFSSRNPSFQADVMRATNGKGVDVVLNSLAGPLLHATWECVAESGRFIEIGKRDAQSNMALRMANFGKAISFMAMDIMILLLSKGQKLNKSFREVMRMLKTKGITHQMPILSYQLSDLRKAFRYLQGGKHIGKIVVNVQEGDEIDVIIPPTPVTFDPSASYLVVGGLSGIGLEIARWMAQQGAKHLILMSRSAEQQDTQQIQAELQAAGVELTLRSCDVGDEENLKNVVGKCRETRSIRGVIQAAVVLQDSMFNNMTYQQWQECISPKVDGTRNLSNLFQNDDLEFFVVLSSVTGTLGNMGQANYTAAGTYQDALALNRVSKGLPGVSIDIGSVPSIGLAARTGAGARLDKGGYRVQDVPEMLRLTEIAIRHPKLGQIVTGINTWSTPGTQSWRQEPRFSCLWLPGGSEDSDSSGHGQRLSLRDRLLKSDRELIHEVLVEALRVRLAEILGMSTPGDVDAEVPLTSYGIDSLVAVELRNWVVLNVVSEISIFDITQSTSLNDLASRIKERLVSKLSQ
ncbi:Highly reducing polyketide synthase azaB [Cladobotryum mycophilum]|uniref:Highly reducing polyketide synthase azaB n=1 Tax=Cladobotryum mycophilum TaxID=491253 RepID=A0ABR0SJZ4_9HYPO